MKTYKVTGHFVIFGIGMVLKLSRSQAEARIALLKKKSKDIYIILEPVQFKKGEIINIVSGKISKAILSDLEIITGNKKAQILPPENKNDSADDNINDLPT